MAVKVRFARIGKKHAPVYRIVAIDSHKKRDGKYLENIGTYNPKTKEIVKFDDDRLAYWVSVGAVVSDSVKRLAKIRKKQDVAPTKEAPKNAEKAIEKKEAPKKAALKAQVKKAETVKKETPKQEAPKKATAKKSE